MKAIFGVAGRFRVASSGERASPITQAAWARIVSRRANSRASRLMTSGSSRPVSFRLSARTKTVGLPALIRVARSGPMSGISSRSWVLPVGNRPPGPESAGSRNSSVISAPAKGTPSSRKLPSSTTAPWRVGTSASMRFCRFCCQMRTLVAPSVGLTQPWVIAKGPTAAERLPQFPDQSMSALSIETAPKRKSTSQSSRSEGEMMTTLLVLEVAPPIPSVCLW